MAGAWNEDHTGAFDSIAEICFADLGMIPVAIPLIIIARTTLTDAFRSIGGWPWPSVFSAACP